MLLCLIIRWFIARWNRIPALALSSVVWFTERIHEKKLRSLDALLIHSGPNKCWLQVVPLMANTCSTIKVSYNRHSNPLQKHRQHKLQLATWQQNMNDSDVNLLLLTRLLTPVACTFFQRLFASVSSVSSVASNQLKRRFDILSSVPRLQKSKTDFRRFPSSYAKRCCSTFFLFAEPWIGQWRTNTCHYQLPTVTAVTFTMRAGAARLWSFINFKLCARQLRSATACTPPGNDWLRPE